MRERLGQSLADEVAAILAAAGGALVPGSLEAAALERAKARVDELLRAEQHRWADLVQSLEGEIERLRDRLEDVGERVDGDEDAPWW